LGQEVYELNKDNVFAGFRSSYRPPIVTAPDWEATAPANDASNGYHGGTVGSLAHQRPAADVAGRLASSLLHPLLLIVLLAAGILSRASSIL